MEKSGRQRWRQAGSWSVSSWSELHGSWGEGSEHRTFYTEVGLTKFIRFQGSKMERRLSFRRGQHHALLAYMATDIERHQENDQLFLCDSRNSSPYEFHARGLRIRCVCGPVHTMLGASNRGAGNRVAEENMQGDPLTHGQAPSWLPEHFFASPELGPVQATRRFRGTGPFQLTDHDHTRQTRLPGTSLRERNAFWVTDSEPTHPTSGLSLSFSGWVLISTPIRRSI
jgi:hypothetical protein